MSLKPMCMPLTRRLPWSQWFDPALTIRVNVAAIKCPLRSLDFVTLRIKDAVCDTFRETTGRRPDVNTVQPDMRIHGFLDARRFSLYLDTSGDALFKRGIRKNTVSGSDTREPGGRNPASHGLEAGNAVT